MKAQNERLCFLGRNSSLILPGSAFNGRTRNFRHPSKYKQLAVKMELDNQRISPPGEANLEYRVNVRSKKEVIEQLNKYKSILERTFDEQKDVEVETKRVLLQELLAVSYSKVNVEIVTTFMCALTYYFLSSLIKAL